MSDRAALVAAVAAAPDDDLPRLVFADWLDEHGEADRAEFIRLCVAYSSEATAHPPAPDPTKLARIRQLFRDHHPPWLRPVYEPLGQPLPVLGAAGGGINVTDRWHVDDTGKVVISHPLDRALRRLSLSRGLVGMATCSPARLAESANLARAMAAEPLDVLCLTLPADVRVWNRFAGSHLGRVKSLHPVFEGEGDFRPLADSLCSGETFRGVRELIVTPELTGDGTAPGAVLFNTLRGSPLRRQLTALTLYDLPGMGRLLSDPAPGFDALESLAVSTRGWPGGADALYANGIADWFRERLTRLAIEVSRNHGIGWLTSGRPWERLEVLLLSGNEIGDRGATRLAESDTLPALRELRLSRFNITGTGAISLARSSLVRRLDSLFLEGNAVDDAGARELASALDHGLGYLSVRQSAAGVTGSTRQQLTAHYGRRITFT